MEVPASGQALPKARSSDKPLFLTLDGMRGIAALLVIQRHCNAFFGLSIHESYLAVDLFFVLSGAVLANAYQQRLSSGLTVGRFLWLRIARIYPLYAVGSILGIVALSLDGGFRSTPFGGYWPGLVLLPVPLLFGEAPYPLDTPAWSLFFELVANALYGFCAKRLTNKVLIAIICVSYLGVLFSLIRTPARMLDVGWLPGSFIYGFPRVGFSFFLGILVFRGYQRLSAKTPYPFRSPWAACLALVATAACLMAPSPGRYQPIYDLGVVTFVFPAIVWVGLNAQPPSILVRLCRWLGTLSYAIYVLHQPTGHIVSLAARSIMHIRVHDYAPWSGALFLALLIPTCLFLDKYFDGPARRAMAKLGSSS